MQNFKKQFKGKKITVMGLGLLGGAVNDARFLAECGANLTVTDLKTEKQLVSSVKVLKKYKNIKFVLGEHNIKDFKDVDLVLQMGNVSPGSPFLLEAEKNKIPVFVSESLFTKYIPSSVTLIGVTGTRGKSMTTMLIYKILSENLKNRKIYLGGNIRSVSTLALLKKVKSGDIVVMELDSWALHGMGDVKISPHISVFTTFMPDHMNYYKNKMKDYFDDKANIYKYQKKGDILIIRPGIKKLIPSFWGGLGRGFGKLIVVNRKNVSDWEFCVPGEHQRENLACAVKVAEQFKIPVENIKKAVKKFKGLEGRLQFVKLFKGIKIYNDNNATTPDATIAALRALGQPHRQRLGGRNIVLIIGGDNKQLDMSKLVKEIPKWCSKVVMFKEKGTDLIRDKVFQFRKSGIEVYEEEGLNDTVKRAYSVAQKGETILYSPAFSSFGKYFKNEYDRNDQFVKLVKKLK